MHQLAAMAVSIHLFHKHTHESTYMYCLAGMPGAYALCMHTHTHIHALPRRNGHENTP
jgi:hypothetical protein